MDNTTGFSELTIRSILQLIVIVSFHPSVTSRKVICDPSRTKQSCCHFQAYDNEGEPKIGGCLTSVNHANSANSSKSSESKFLQTLGGEPFTEFELLLVDFQGLDPGLEG